MIIIKSPFKNSNHVWIPSQHHRNVADWQGIKCSCKDQTSSLYWTAAKSGFFVLFYNTFALVENGLEKFPPYHCVCISAIDWHPLHHAREDMALKNWPFSPCSYWGYFSLLPVPAANGCEIMLKVTSKSWPGFKNVTTHLFLFYFLFWSQTISVHQLMVRLHKYLCHTGNKTQSYGNNLKARYFIFWSHNLWLGWKTDHWIEPIYK